MVFVILLDIEVDRAVALVGIAIIEDFLNQFLLLDDMTCGMRLYTWRKHVECLHGIVVAVGVILSYFHWLQLLQSCLLFYLVVTLICIVLQVTYVSNVSNIAHLVSQMLEIAEEYIEGNGWARMTEMWISIHGRTTNIHAHIRCMKWSKSFLRTSEGVID